MSSIDEIIERMKSVTNTGSDVELAKYLGLSRSNAISGWKSRNSKPYAYCENISSEKGVTIDWLLTGREPKHIDDRAMNLEQRDINLLTMLKDLSDENRREILSRIKSLYAAGKQSEKIKELETQIKDLIKRVS